ncbi:hypothetical protein [Caballeronia sp. BR00000012568055]|uniref:hypothetical protein n=1 Tax=Caballeronia sp. BR00000012568055 TaxID=2918761 RepID=UPI0023F635B9|nr:hypothetical protein [Caballeronia sp. BR00000012568055]
MTDPLIVVEGTLRLPSLRPLADPSSNYGHEWSAARSRATHKQSEISLFGAHMQTEYVEAITLSGSGSSYRAASIWAVFADDSARLSMLRVIEEIKSGVAAEPPAAPKTEPIQLAFNEPVEKQATPESRMPAFLKTAIALACAALISWMIVGYESHRSGSTEAAAPAATYAEMDTKHDEAPAVPSPASSPAPALAAVHAPAVMARSTEASAPRVVTAASPIVVSDRVKPVVATPAPKAKRIEPRAKKQLVKASNAGKPIKVSAVQKVQKAQKQSGGTSVVHSPRVPQSQYQADADDYQMPAKPHRTRATVSRPLSNSTDAAPSAPKPNPSIDTMALYNMLQHSATLDSNVRTSDASAK